MDEMFMKRALVLAKQGRGHVDPNPLVGAVLVKDGRIIGEGYHACYGEAHAEVRAFENATESVAGATLYVTLEPCAHTGKTPPCATRIIDKQIARVVIGSIDPNPLVSGRGMTMLKQAGITVKTGLLDDENKTLNRAFFKHITTGLPYVVMKTAMTADGKIATKTRQSRWITGPKAREHVHQLRHEMMAIMVGVKTVMHDNPALTVRHLEGTVRQPIRVVLDSRLDIPLDALVVATAQTVPTWVMTTHAAPLEKINQLKAHGVVVHTFDAQAGEVDVLAALTHMGASGINSILLEGGGTLNHAMFTAGLVDALHLFIAPKIFGGANAPTPVEGEGVTHVESAWPLSLQRIEHYDDDLCLIYTVKKE
ncbi:MAG: bifunctional diaminohydroxyphosphoribosylaminopyrimidine deaminase/5-amino-6-(5-phosphoribosylamino)uracil reductase RibD [Acholeplasmatales bacterium]|nr:MAG: bifunctional diaminohydroxyphosphoribosylaminopyrimidine deaminase/5-amino-6-(5-phosphoribosylamino)uracil reductase RibD [Acholeplasmatales bacterium]